MADLSSMYGEDPQNLQRVLAQLKELEAAKSELDVKERALGETERGTTRAIMDNSSALQRAIDDTRALTTETNALTTRLTQETTALKANSEAWVQQVALMTEAAKVSRTIGPARPRASRATTAAEAAAVAPITERPIARAESLITPTPNQSLAARQAQLDALQREQTQAASARSRWTQSSPEAQAIAQAREDARQRQMQVAAAQGDHVAVAARNVATAAPKMLMPPSAGTPEMGAASASQRASAETATRNARALEIENAELRRTDQLAKDASIALEHLAEVQTQVTVTANREMAAFAGVDNVLSRNGALTTEFIQALARGEVTMQEFGSQMTSTIGKFGGWAIAGAAVYGVADAFKHVAAGAAETQSGIQNLSRFIPGVASGPQRTQAESTFRNISSQMNLPISEVTSAMQVMARVFHNVADAGKATQAVLLATRLDKIPQAQSEQYLVGIGQSLGYTGRGGGQQLIGVIDSLNALQNQYGARVNQTLPGVARAAPAAQAGGLSTPMLEALIGTAVRSGVSGAQAGTALLRSIGTRAFSPHSQQVFRQYGINAQPGQYGNLISQLVTRVTKPKAGQELTGQDLQQLSVALGGTRYGPRTLLPMLEHANLTPGMEATVAKPPSAQQELNKVLGSVGEQAKRLGIELQNVGSELESAGILTPIELLLQGLGSLGHAIGIVISPFQAIGQVVNQLPGAFKDVLGVLAAGAGVRAASRSNWGLATQQGISRLPGLSGLRDDQRQAVNDAAARAQSELPIVQDRARSARRRSLEHGYVVQDALNTEEAARARVVNAPPEEIDQRTATANDAGAKLEQAQAKGVELQAQADIEQERANQAEAQYAVLRRNSVSIAQRYLYMQEKGLIEEESIQTSLSKQARVEAEIANIGKGGIGTATAVAAPLAAGVLGGSRATEALQNASPEVQAAALGATAIAENPSIIQQVAQTGNLPLAEASGNAAQTAANAGLFARLRSSPIGQKVGGVASKFTPGRVMGSAVAGAEAGQGGMGGLGLGLVGGMIGGGVGSAMSDIGMGAFFAGQFGGSVGGSIGGMLDRAAVGFGRTTPLGARAALTEAASSPMVGAGLGLAMAGSHTSGLGGQIESGLGLGLTTTMLLGGPANPIADVAGLAAGVGGFLFGGGGSSTPPPGLSANAKRLQVHILGGLPNVSSQVPFSQNFAAELNTAYNNGNTTQADAAQAQVQKTIRSLSQVLKDSKYGGKLAGTEQASLAAAIGGASTTVGFSKDPGSVGMNIDTAQQAIASSTQSYLGYAMAQNPTQGGESTALASANAQLAHSEAMQKQAVKAQGIQGSIAADRTTLSAAQTRLHAAPASTRNAMGFVVQGTRTSDQAAVTKASMKLGTDQQRLTQSNEILASIKQADLVTAQANAATYLQQVQQNIANTTTVLQAFTGSKTQQAAEGVKGAIQNLNAVRSAPVSPLVRKQSEATAKAAVGQAEQQSAQNAAQQLQARQAVSASTIPTFDPIRQATVALQHTAAYYNKLKNAVLPGTKNPAYDASTINQALAARNAAAVALNDAVYQFSYQTASDVAAVTEAQNPANALAQGQAQAHLGQVQMGLARNRPERLQAQAQLLQGQTAAKQALQARAQANYQIVQTQQTGDPVAAAETGIAASYTALAMALGPDQVLAAKAQLAQSVQQLHQANQAYIQQVGALKASQTNNVLAQDSANLSAAQQALAQAVTGNYGKSTVLQDQTTVNQAILQQTNDYVQQRMSTIQFQQSTLQVSAQGALKQLQGLAKLKNLSVQERQQIVQQAYAIETNQNNTSLFDLTPAGSSVKVPTIYDVRNNAARERARLAGQHHDVGGLSDRSGKVNIGGASVGTTDGAVNTHDVISHAKLDTLISLLRTGSGAAVVSGHSGLGGAMSRTARRVMTHAKSAGLSGV